jgi:ribose transport system permease protein
VTTSEEKAEPGSISSRSQGQPASRASTHSRPWSHLSRGTRTTLGSVFFIVVMYLVFGAIKPVFFTPNNFRTLAQQGAILLLVSLGATFVVLMGMIDLSVGSLVTLSAISLAVLEPHLGALSIPAAMLITIAAGLLNGVIVTLFRLPSFLVTLGMLSVIQGVAQIIGSTYVQVNNGFLNSVTVSHPLGLPADVIWAAIGLVVLSWVAVFTVFGRGAYAIGGGEKVTRLVGMHIRRYKIIAFMLSALTCSIAGIILVGELGAGTPTIGSTLLLNSVAAIAVGGTALTGGVGGPWSTAIGAGVITVLAGGMVVLRVNPNTQSLIEGFVLIAAVYFTMDRSRTAVVK